MTKSKRIFKILIISSLIFILSACSKDKKAKIEFNIPEDYPEFKTDRLYQAGVNVWYEGDVIKVAKDSEMFDGKYLVKGDVIIETKDFNGNQHDIYMQQLKKQGAFEEGSDQEKDEYYFDTSFADVKLYFSNEGVTVSEKFKNSYKRNRKDITYIKTNLPDVDKIKQGDHIKGYGKTGGFFVQNEISEYSIQDIDTKMAEVGKR